MGAGAARRGQRDHPQARLRVQAAIAAPDAYPSALPFALAVAGLGAGLFTPPFFTTALDGVGPQETGSAAGLLNAVQQLGGTLGVAVAGGIYLAGADAPHAAAQAALATAVAILAATAIAAAAMTSHRTAAPAAPAAAESATPPTHT
ncbi:hypothetical protein [Streptomyces sp. NPDC050121]|uniref:hypothetical protein n=1 Tax=Streptomyces sp. NPDC050121 TaxID=3365601 RepID=UPI00378927C9